jgi:membrane protease YdiL (CAAX protease family)
MTTFWAFVIFFIFGISQGLGVVIAAAAWDILDVVMAGFTNADSSLQEQMIYSNDLAWPAAFASSLIGSLLIFVLIAAKRGLKIKDYLHLNKVSAQVWAIWVIVILVMMGLSEWLATDSEALQTPFMKDVVRGTKSFPMLILTVGVLAPIFEELFFRGFIFKGLERGILGGHGTVWLTSIIFAAIHLQYAWPIVLMIIPMGLLLGYSRMYSGSLLVPIVLHVLNNTIAIGYTAYELHQGAAF